MNPFGLFVIVATTLFPAIQLFSLPNVSDQIALFSQYLGLAALILMAWGQILSTRMPPIETFFGGLDRVYVLHKWAGIIAMVAILLHDTIDAEMRGLGRETALNELAETLGEISLYGLLILVVISIATFVPYHLWRWTHKVMGAFFAAATFHFVFIMKPFAMSDPAGLYTGLFCLAGFLAYIWMLLPEHMHPSRGYKITNLTKTGQALAISLAPDGKALRPAPGQFGVLRFTGSGHSEPHPFSFSKIGTDGTLRVTIKSLGDFTHRLENILEVGQGVRVQGPFGRFRFAAKGPEVWIAGGIGITPFLAWADAFDGASGTTVDIFFCVSAPVHAAHLDELQAIADAKPNLNLHIIDSSTGPRLTADLVAQTVKADLSDVKVSFCGPQVMRETLRRDLRRFGVTPRRFHFEEFEFRTGIGLKRLAVWILKQRAEAAREAKRQRLDETNA